MPNPVLSFRVWENGEWVEKKIDADSNVVVASVSSGDDKRVVSVTYNPSTKKVKVVYKEG